ncbi:MAG: AAA family ATPase [Lachnospira sp.]|nr:AAA family ATPase [Lachnospira sp.]
MNIKEAKQEIINTVKAYLCKNAEGEYRIPAIRQRPVLLMGPPGIGKTQIMEQIASECGIGLVSYTITHHTRQSAVGLPMIKTEEFDGNEYSVTEYTMSEIIAGVYKAIKEQGHREGILFIDEINCVSETLIPTMLQFLQCKTFGNQKVPEGWIIVAAGNPPEFNRSVREFDMVTYDRLRVINIDADLEVWREYAREREIHNAILSYLDIRPQNFYRVEADVDGLKFVTARGWEDMSSLMYVYEELGISINAGVVGEFLHNEDIAEDFAAYYDLYNKYRDDYGINNILAGNATSDIYRRMINADYDERLTVVNLLLDTLNKHFKYAAELKADTDSWYKSIKEKIKAGEDEGAIDKEKAEFSKQAEKLDSVEEQTLAKLENAFDFLEGSKQEISREDIGKLDQEMLIFVTGLTTGKESSSFLLVNPCDRYKSYSAMYLKGGRRNQLLKEME